MVSKMPLWNTKFRLEHSDRENMGAFHSTKTSGLNFWQFPIANGTAFPKISKKGTTHPRRPRGQIKGADFFPEVFFPCNFATGISRIFGWMVRVSGFQQFPEFWKLFREFLYHLPLFPNFRKFWLNGKRPRTTFSDVPLLLEIFRGNKPKSHFPFT